MATPSGRTEREPLRCEGCGVRYRNPHLAILLSVALPGLGSIYLRRPAWGALMLAMCAAALLGLLWRAGVHFRRAWETGASDPRRMATELALALLPALLAYGADLLMIWMRRDQLVPL